MAWANPIPYSRFSLNLFGFWQVLISLALAHKIARQRQPKHKPKPKKDTATIGAKTNTIAPLSTLLTPKH